MLIRVVSLRFADHTVSDFLAHFEQHKQQIRNFPGNLHLELLRDMNDPNRFFTYSYWESAEALERYRRSDFFGEVWTYTKTLFSEAPMAWSVERIDQVTL